MGTSLELSSPRGNTGPQRFVAALSALVVVNVVAFFLGDAGRAFGLAGAVVLPFAVLAGLSYAGESQRWARVMALVLLGIIAVLVAGTYLGQSVELLQRRGDGALDRHGESQVTVMFLLMSVGLLAATLTLLTPIRRALSPCIPLAPDRFVHAVALSLTLTITVSALAPLIVLAEPILTALVAETGPAEAPPQDEATPGMHGELFHLYWLIPVSILAVGYGLRRSLRQCLQRLGVVRPTLRQILISIGIAGLLVIGVAFFGAGVDWLWRELGWPRTDRAAFTRMMSDFLTPTGALVLGVSAGVGEELVVRGVLQPRLGLILPNLLFTALHAGQYNWDFLVIILGLGLVFGLIRKYGNTTMSMIVHGVYDILIVLIALAGPEAGM